MATINPNGPGLTTTNPNDEVKIVQGKVIYPKEDKLLKAEPEPEVKDEPKAKKGK